MATRLSANDERRVPSKGDRADAPTDISSRGWKQIAKRTISQIGEDNVGLMAGGVAYYAMMSLFPAIAATVMIYGLVADPQQVTQTVQSFTQALPNSASGLIDDQLTNVASSSGGALGVGVAITILTALWGASSGMKGLIGGINTAYDESETRKFVPLRGLAVGLTLVAIIGLLVAVTLVAVLPAVLGAVGLGSLEPVIRYGRWPLLAVLVMAALAHLYKVAPDRDDAKFKWVTPGSVVATVLWLIGSAVFSLYVSNFGSYDETYGALGGVIVLLLWFFLTGFIVLLGAELNAEMERQTVKDTTVGSPDPIGQRGAEAADDLPPMPVESRNGDSAAHRMEKRNEH